MKLRARGDASTGLSYREEARRLLGVDDASDEDIWLLTQRRAGLELETALRDQGAYDLFFHLDLLALNARAAARLLSRIGERPR